MPQSAYVLEQSSSRVMFQGRAFLRELLELFGADVHPDVVFLVDSIGGRSSRSEWSIHGRLTMNGVTRPVTFVGTARMVEGRMIATGSANVDLRDWRIRPPRRFGGLIGMSSKLRLTFRAEFRPRDATHTALAAPENKGR